MVVTLAVLGGLVFFYFLVSALIANGMIMADRVKPLKTPSDYNLEYEEVSFPSRIDKVNINGWLIKGNGKGTILVMHGGKQCRSDDTINLIGLCSEMALKGYNVLTFDRRSCGTSAVGKFRSRAKFDRDYGGAIDYIQSRYGGNENVFIIGMSIGAAAAISFTSSCNSVKAIVADSCFLSSEVMGRRVMGDKCKLFEVFTPGAAFMGRVICGLPKKGSLELIKKVPCPIMFICGEWDATITAADTKKLKRASCNLADEIWIAENAPHNKAYMKYPKKYVKMVTKFFEDSL